MIKFNTFYNPLSYFNICGFNPSGTFTVFSVNFEVFFEYGSIPTNHFSNWTRQFYENAQILFMIKIIWGSQAKTFVCGGSSAIFLSNSRFFLPYWLWYCEVSYYVTESESCNTVPSMRISKLMTAKHFILFLLQQQPRKTQEPIKKLYFAIL